MKKTFLTACLTFIISDLALAAPVCSDLFNEKIEKKKYITEKNKSISKSTLKLEPLIKKLLIENSAITDIFIGKRPSWEDYKVVSDILNIISKNEKILFNENDHIYLLKISQEKNNEIQQAISSFIEDKKSLKSYKKHLDENYSFFKILAEINLKIGEKIFPEARLDLVPTNEQTIKQAKNFLSSLNKEFHDNFQLFGHESYEKFTEFAKNVDDTAKKGIHLLDNHLIVAMHRPENARFWLPLTGFQNQRTTKSSRGYYDSESLGRSTAESNLTGIPLKDYTKKSVRFMPNYAEAIPDLLKTNITVSSYADQYGSDIWVLKTENIKNRSTVSPTDSLGYGYNYSKGENVLQKFIPWSYKNILIDYLYNKLLENTYYPSDKSNKFNLKNDTWKSGSAYTEVQIFGSLTLDDVAEFRFRKNPPNKELIQILKSKNIKIYDDRNYQNSIAPTPWEEGMP